MAKRGFKHWPAIAVAIVSVTVIAYLFLQLQDASLRLDDALTSIDAREEADRLREQSTRQDRASTNTSLILIIGDGMDDQQLSIARNYLVGTWGQMTLDRLPYRGAALPQAVSDTNPDQPVFVSDSANTATTMATGVVTSRGRIATTAGTNEDIPTIMEMAIDAGIATGIVTTARLTDATPAAFLSHASNRFCQGPDDMVMTEADGTYFPRDCSARYQDGGGGSIAEQLATSEARLLFGGGADRFSQMTRFGSAGSVADLARESGFQVISDLGDIADPAEQARTLALFSESEIPVRLRGSDRGVARLVDRSGDEPVLPDAFECIPNHRFEGMPTLAEMTAAAIRQLASEDRFMLMIESASIDKEMHGRRPCGSIGEVAQLNEALDVALDYAADHPDEVLIIVTADHGSSAHMIAETSLWSGRGHASIGHLARIRTPFGGIMGVNYASNDARQEEHTGVQVPVYAAGIGVSAFPTYITQVDIFRLSRQHLGL